MQSESIQIINAVGSPETVFTEKEIPVAKKQRQNQSELKPEPISEVKVKKAVVPQKRTSKSDVQIQVQAIASEYGWGEGTQWEALSWIIMKESSWNPNAQNPKSTAYGLFQFLDATWKGYGCPKTTDITIQTHCGIKYIKARYGTPQEAKKFHINNNWY